MKTFEVRLVNKQNQIFKVYSIVKSRNEVADDIKRRFPSCFIATVREI